KKQRTSQPRSIGGVRNSAPRARSDSYAARQSGTRIVNASPTVVGSVGAAKVTSGLSSVGGPPVTSRSQAPWKSSTADVPPYSRNRRAPSTFTYQALTARRPGRRGCASAPSPASGTPSRPGVLAPAVAQDPLDLADELAAGRQALLVDHRLESLHVLAGRVLRRRRGVAPGSRAPRLVGERA